MNDASIPEQPPAPAPGRNGRWVRLGEVGVDGAACGITDPVFAESPQAMPPGVTQAAEFGSGVQFWCGFGDGGYDVWAWVVDYGSEDQPDERIAQVTVTFIDQAGLDAWNADQDFWAAAHARENQPPLTDRGVFGGDQ